MKETLAMADAGELTIRIKAIDEASEVIANIAQELELLETSYDWRVPLGSALGAFAGTLLAVLVGGAL
jgi:hypothetical protein